MILTTEHEMFRESLRDFIDREIAPHVTEWEAQQAFPYRDLYRKMGQEGFLGLTYSEEYGGLGLDYGYTLVWGEELGRIAGGGIPMSVSVQTDMCTPAIAKYGSDLLKREFLQPAIYGEKIGAIAVTEPGAGSDVAAIRTEAKRDGDHYVINGSKAYITNGGIADFVVILCRTSQDGIRGMSLLVVPTDTPGFTITKTHDKLGNRICNHASMRFEDVRVPVDYLIGEEGNGFKMQMEQFMSERLILGIITCSQAQAVLEKTKAYAKERHVFDQPLLQHQHIGFTLVDLELELTFLQQMVTHTVQLYMEGKECTREVAMIKLKASRLLRAAADHGLQIFGGYGYMEESGMPQLYRDARAASLAGGTDEVMQYLLQKYL
ncbi:MAG TPA: acyl-CoA dehydrogenase family protein [Bacilli bacterium]|nr:acyl-CoA dehydrogenase family protein [Bacilli bacterium]